MFTTRFTMYGGQPFIVSPHYPPPLPPPPYNGQYYLPPPPHTNNGFYPPVPPPLLPPVLPPQNSFGGYYPLNTVPPHRQSRHFRHRGASRNLSTPKRPNAQIISCHTCNREYKSDETYQAHVQAHVKCDQCEYTALPKLVREHSVIHSLPDFLVFSTPEDTQKWRSERKKNYPTVANVAKKKQQESKRKDRRQILDTPLYRYVNQLIGDNEQTRGRGGRRRGRGGNRGSSRGGRWQSHSCQNSSRYDGKNNEAQEEDKNNDQKRLSSNDVFNCGPKRKRLKNTEVFRKNPTLLEKLLCNEVRREHNIILQCVHHIVSNNFWDQNNDIK